MGGLKGDFRVKDVVFVKAKIRDREGHYKGASSWGKVVLVPLQLYSQRKKPSLETEAWTRRERGCLVGWSYRKSLAGQMEAYYLKRYMGVTCKTNERIRLQMY